MKNLTEEKNRLLSLMGIDNSAMLSESATPPAIILKLAKYFSHNLDIATKSVDELYAEFGQRLTKSEIKFLKENADEISRLAKKIVDPNASFTDNVLIKFDDYISKIPQSTIDSMAKKSFDNFVASSSFVKTIIKTYIPNLEKYAKEFISQNRVSSEVFQSSINRGNTFREIFIAELKKQGVDDELLLVLLKKFDENDTFKAADDIISNIKTPELSYFEKLSRLSDSELLRINRVFEEIRTVFKSLKKSDVLWQDSQRLIRQFEEINLTSNQIKGNVQRLRENLLGIIRDDKRTVIEFESALKRVEKEIDDLNVDDITKAEIKKQLKTKMIQNVFGSSIGETNWIDDIIEDLKIAQGIKKDPENTASLLQKRYAGIDPKKQYSEGFKGFSEKSFDFGSNFIKRLINIATTGQFRFLPEITSDLYKKRGSWARKFLSTYIRLFFIQYVTLPLVSSALKIPFVLGQCARIDAYNKEIKNKIDAAGGTEQDLSKVLQERPTVCDNVNGDAFDVFLSLFKGESIDKLVKDLLAVVTNDKEGNYAESLGDNWYGDIINYIENIIDLLNPFSTIIDDVVSTAYDYKTYESLMGTYYDQVENVLETIEQRKLELESEKNKIQNIALTPEEILKKKTDKQLIVRTLEGYILPELQTTPEYTYIKNNMQYDIEKKLWYIPSAVDTNKRHYFEGNAQDGYYMTIDGKQVKPKEWGEIINLLQNEFSGSSTLQQNESIKKILKNIIMENNGKKFGEDNFKHWKETFTFKSEDKGNPGQFKEVKIKMEDVMDRISHYRKKYDEDDSFVRAVVDTHPDVVKIMYTKGLADINESATPRGLALVLRVIKESRGEMEIFSVARPANGNWFLVKGDYTQSQLANMDLEKKEPKDKEEKKEVSGSEELKKKEQTAIDLLKRNEKEGLNDLPTKVREKLREKMGKGWTTEPMPSFLNKIAIESEINTIFNDKIEIYKLESNDETFDAIADNSSQIFIKRGFCRSLYVAADNAKLNEKQEKVVDHILDKCDKKFLGKLGVRNF